MQSSIAINLTELSRQEKLRLWMARAGVRFVDMAAALDVTPAAIGKLCKQTTMPEHRHRALVDFGVPADLLPAPLNIKSGPRPRARCTTTPAPSPVATA